MFLFPDKSGLQDYPAGVAVPAGNDKLTGSLKNGGLCNSKRRGRALCLFGGDSARSGGVPRVTMGAGDVSPWTRATKGRGAAPPTWRPASAEQPRDHPVLDGDARGVAGDHLR